MLQTGLKTETG